MAQQVKGSVTKPDGPELDPRDQCGGRGELPLKLSSDL